MGKKNGARKSFYYQQKQDRLTPIMQYLNMFGPLLRDPFAVFHYAYSHSNCSLTI